MTPKELMELWRGIPARYVANALSLTHRSVNWSGSSKADMAEAVADKRHGDYGDPKLIAILARKEQKHTQKYTADKRRIREEMNSYRDRRVTLSTLTSAQLDAVVKALEDRDLSAEGARVTLTKDWYNRRTAGSESLKRALVRAEKDYKINLIMDLERSMRAAQTAPAVKESSDA